MSIDNPAGASINGNQFEASGAIGGVDTRFSGTFNSATAISGTFTISDACGVASGTWSAAPGNAAPRASAGAAQSGTVGAVISLSGHAHDVNDDPLTYQWSFESVPTGSAATLADATTTTPRFTPDRPGTYLLRLVVSDGKVNSALATVAVTVTATSLDGIWSGTTGLNKAFSFTVSNNSITTLTVAYAATSCGSNSTGTTTFTPAIALSGSTVSYSVSGGLIRALAGSFQGSTSASGTVTLRHEDFNFIPPCFQTISTTWSVTLQ